MIKGKKIHPVMNEDQMRLDRAVDAAFCIAEGKAYADLRDLKDTPEDCINPRLVATRILHRYKIAMQISKLARDLDAE